MKLLCVPSVQIILLLVIFVECCLFFGVDCDLLLRDDDGGFNARFRGDSPSHSELARANRTGGRPDSLSGLLSIRIEDPRLRNKEDIAERDVAANRIAETYADAQKGKVISTSGRTIIVKRSAGATQRRKIPRIPLAPRPRGSATTSTTTTTTTTSSSTTLADTGDSDSATKSEQSDEGARENEEVEGEEYEEVEGESSTEETTEEAPKKVAPKSTPNSKEQQSKTSTSKLGKISESEGNKSQRASKSSKEQEPASAEPPKKSRTSVAQSTSRENGSEEEPPTAATTTTTASITKKKKKPLMALPFIKAKNSSVCIPEAYLEFPRDMIGSKWRGRGLILIHIAVVCYMFYSLALVCERYFMPSLEEFSQRLQLSEDVAGATLMSAGSSAPELFTAILGVFIAKGDIGTGTIVGSAVFNILFVIGICAFVSTSTAQLNWWPVLRDSVFYSFTVLVLILCIYDERVTALESFAMLALYGVYILIMVHNESIKECVTRNLLAYPVTANLISSAMSVEGPDDVFGSPGLAGSNAAPASSGGGGFFSASSSGGGNRNYQTTSMIGVVQKSVEEDSMFLAACLVIVRHKRLFKSQLRFQSAARYIIIKRQHRLQQQQLKQQKQQTAASKSNEVNYFGPENEPLKNSQRDRMDAFARSTSMSKNKFSIVSKDDYEFWNRPPEDSENYYLWLAKIPVNYVLHYTIPDCSLHPDKYIFTFVVSILWTALFSYIMVWMVTLIGYTLGIPDSVMGATFLAAGTSVPDCYSSIHAARNGMADMAVSNSIGSNVFDILVGLSLPWFIQTAIYPGVVATINSRGVIYSVILLFLSLIVTIYLMNKYEWTLKPRLGLALLIAYGLFIVLSCMLEFNLFGHVNPPSCPVD